MTIAKLITPEVRQQLQNNFNQHFSAKARKSAERIQHCMLINGCIKCVFPHCDMGD